MVSPGLVYAVLITTGFICGAIVFLIGIWVHNKDLTSVQSYSLIILIVGVMVCGTLGIQRLKDLQEEAYNNGYNSGIEFQKSMQRMERSGLH